MGLEKIPGDKALPLLLLRSDLFGKLDRDARRSPTLKLTANDRERSNRR